MSTGAAPRARSPRSPNASGLQGTASEQKRRERGIRGGSDCFADAGGVPRAFADEMLDLGRVEHLRDDRPDLDAVVVPLAASDGIVASFDEDDVLESSR